MHEPWRIVRGMHGAVRDAGPGGPAPRPAAVVLRPGAAVPGPSVGQHPLLRRVVFRLFQRAGARRGYTGTIRGRLLQVTASGSRLRWRSRPRRGVVRAPMLSTDSKGTSPADEYRRRGRT